MAEHYIDECKVIMKNEHIKYGENMCSGVI